MSIPAKVKTTWRVQLLTHEEKIQFSEIQKATGNFKIIEFIHYFVKLHLLYIHLRYQR